MTLKTIKPKLHTFESNHPNLWNFCGTLILQIMPSFEKNIGVSLSTNFSLNSQQKETTNPTQFDYIRPLTADNSIAQWFLLILNQE